MSHVTIIILHWHNTAEVNLLLQQISSWDRDEFVTIVVDNSQDFDASPFEWVTMLSPDENMGFAGGNNLGIRHALDSGSSYVLLLNADIDITATDVTTLLQDLQKNNLAAIAPVLLETHNEKQVYNYGGRNPITHSNTRIATTETVDPKIKPDYLPGTAVLIDTKAFDKIGLLDESYFFSGEIADWFLRLGGETDMQFEIHSDTIVEHFSSGNESYRSTHYIYYSLRNRYLLIRKFGGADAKKLSQIWTKTLRRQMIGALLRLQFNRFMTIYRAIKDGFGGRFGKSLFYS